MALSTTAIWGRRDTTARASAPPEVTPLERRRELVKELETLRRDDRPRIAELLRAVVEADRKADEARQAHRSAVAKSQADGYSREHRRDEIRQELLAGSPPEIAEAIAQLEGQIEEAMRAQRTVTHELPGNFHARPTVRRQSNRVAIEGFIEASRIAIQKMSDLRFQALDEKGLARKLKSILGAVPTLDLSLVEVKQ